MNQSKFILFILIACISPLKIATASNSSILFNSGLIINIEEQRKSCSMVATFEDQVIELRSEGFQCLRDDIERFSLSAQSKTS